MRHLECRQGGDDWKMARLGIPTASEFHKIVKDLNGSPSKSRGRYLCDLLAEIILGFPVDSATTPAMLHGTDSEKKAVDEYEMMHGVETRECGLCMTDDGLFGASPDRFVVGARRSLEVKAPKEPGIHL